MTPEPDFHEPIPLIERAHRHGERVAIVAEDRRLTFAQLLDISARAATTLLDGAADLAEARVAFLAPSDSSYVVVQWAVWRAGGIAVPLCPQHPEPELRYVIEDADATILVAHPDFADRLRPMASGRRLCLTSELEQAAPEPLPDVAATRRAMLLYTSGTTSRPKGAVSTHAAIAAQITSLIEAWGWSGDDHILHVLPLHHIHGIVNVLGCAQWAGATCEMLPRFDADTVWARLADPEGLTLFMAVPTIYARLIAAWEAADDAAQARMSAGCRRLRLMVSGSAALPVPTLEAWRGISGHTLLERYGMTEIGMALSNPLDGERRPGCVGAPLPGMDVRLVDAANAPVADGTPGEIQVRGPAVFREYWHRPEATGAAFTSDGWFKTGDVATCEAGVYRILGRESVDIIKTGGYKVSALEIEDVLRTHDAIDQVAVVGVDDDQWGQRVAAAVVVVDGHTLALEQLRAWGKQHLAPYKVPSLLLAVDALPRNALGKVMKPKVTGMFEGRMKSES